MGLDRPRVISLPYKNTGYGSRTVNWVFEWYGDRWVRVMPHLVELSKTGRHGTEYFEIRSDRYVVVQKMVSNSGKRTYSISGTDKGAADRIVELMEMWTKGIRISPDDVLNVLNGR